jgi:hypothetical protein
MEENHAEITVTAFQAKDGAKHAWAAGLARSGGKTVITLGAFLATLQRQDSRRPRSQTVVGYKRKSARGVETLLDTCPKFENAC